MKALSKERLFLALLKLCAIIALTWPLWLHGFPLLYSDSGTYLISAKIGEIPIDRPYAYSYFLVFFAKLIGVYWLPVIQAILVVYLGDRFLNKTVFKSLPSWTASVLFIAMAVFTGLPHLVCQMMPDLFTPFLFLLIWELMQRQKTRESWISLGFLFFIVATHSSHMLLALILIPCLAFVRFYLDRDKKVFYKLALLIAVWMIIPTVNFIHAGRYYLSDSSRVFFVASLQNAGILSPWLERHCGEEEAPAFLCANKEQLRHISGNDILWGSDMLTDSTCLAQAGWGYCWRIRNEELAPFMKTWWKDKASRDAYLSHAWKATWQQAFDYGVGMISSQKEGSAPYSVLEQHYQKDLDRYKSSDQFDHDLFFHTQTKTQWWAVLLSILSLPFLVFIAWRKGRWKKEWTVLILCLFLFLIANAAVCGVLSNPVDRYQARVIWLVPFIIMAVGLSVFSDAATKEVE